MKTVFVKIAFIALCAFASVSCLKDDSKTIMLSSGVKAGNIPHDSEASPNPDVYYSNVNIPNFQYTTEVENGNTIIRIDMTGVQTPDGDYMYLVGTGGSDGEAQNVWVEVDGQPKGILVYNAIDNEQDVVIKNDFVFLVDNSGSMSEEADAIARDIIAWASGLSTLLDVRFACVGYNGNITGGINLTTYNQLSDYLNRSTGIDRTFGFGGPDASNLNSKSYYYDISSQEECGMAALHFANDCFTFRENSNRIYVNFTDEPNYPAYISKYSVHYLGNQYNWDASKGTIHTVFSGSTSFSEQSNYQEKPWRMSDYTGGTILYANSNFTGVKLDNLPVTSAMQNSYVIKFSNIESLMDGNYHTVEITIKSADGSVQATKTFSIKFA